MIVIQENRSFDNLFQGYPGANTASSGYTSNGTLVKLQPVSLAAKYDMYHQFINALDDINGGLMNGFDTEAGDCGPSCPPNPAYSYVPASETQPYYSMAGQYVLADDFFPSDEDGSFVSHQYLIAAQAMQTYGIPANLPWGCDGDSTVLLLNAQTIPERRPTRRRRRASRESRRSPARSTSTRTSRGGSTRRRMPTSAMPGTRLPRSRRSATAPNGGRISSRRVPSS